MKRTLLGKHCAIVHNSRMAQVNRYRQYGCIVIRKYRLTHASARRLDRAYHTF